LALFAKNGLLPNEIYEKSILENDIKELLGLDSDFLSPYHWNINFSSPLIYYQSGNDIVLCKSWVHKKWDKVKKFAKKHKTAIIVGAAIVVAVVVVVATAGTGSPGAAGLVSAAGAAGAGGAAAASNSDEDDESSSESTAAQSTIADSQNHPNLSAVLEDQISSFKELVIEENLLYPAGASPSRAQPSIADSARELGSFLAHETLEGITKLTSWVPELFEEAQEFAAKVLPEAVVNSDNFLWKDSPARNFESLLMTGHKKIDAVFSTDQAERYPKETDNKYTIGIIPSPGSLAISGTPGRIPVTLASETCGWQIGESITNRTIFGTVPKWNTVRRRYWKNQAYLHPEKYESEQLERMKQGLAPQRLNTDTGQLESMELHHDPAQRDGGLFDFIEVWPQEHAKLDPKRYVKE
jgi:filamentous hemagglutinin